jgi:hypothetical protein
MVEMVIILLIDITDHIQMYLCLSQARAEIIKIKGEIWDLFNILLLSPLKLWVSFQLMARCTRYNMMWYRGSMTCSRSVIFCFLCKWNWPNYTTPWMGFELSTLVVIGTDCSGSCKSNYHIMITMALRKGYKCMHYSENNENNLVWHYLFYIQSHVF